MLILNKILEAKPTIYELCEHIDVGTKWYQLGVLLKLSIKQLDAIEQSNKDVTHKTTKMFEMWLTTNPTANRRQLITVLRKPSLSENSVADNYEAILPQCKMTICQYILTYSFFAHDISAKSPYCKTKTSVNVILDI